LDGFAVVLLLVVAFGAIRRNAHTSHVQGAATPGYWTLARSPRCSA